MGFSSKLVFYRVINFKKTISLFIGTSLYNPKIPATLKFPGPTFCSKNTKLMVIGSIPKFVTSVPSILIADNEGNSGIHINIDLKKKMVARYSILNGTMSEIGGAAGDGTSIDFEEPFVLNLSCDEDGWNLQINSELTYNSVLHVVPLENLTMIRVTGDIIINFIGIGSTGFNL